MKLCPQCNKNTIDDKYSMCMSCLKETKEANKSVDFGEIIKKIEQINWNLGSINLTQKLGLLSKLETLKCKQGLTKIQQKIHKLLLDKADKDLKNVSEIEGELKNV